MEEDRFGLLGAPVVARGHLRNYAVLVGAPERQVMEAFEVGDVPEPTFLPALERTPAARAGGRAGWIAAAILLAALAAALAWWWVRS
jgi:cytoskeletal protein RodZ